jgi:hypothetical protein
MSSSVLVRVLSYNFGLNRLWRLVLQCDFLRRVYILVLVGLLVLRLVRLGGSGMEVNHISYLAPFNSKVI